jgi:hypothetical protein
MVFWTFIVAYAFLFIWAVLNEYDSITSSELTLLGISASRGLGAIFIDQINPSLQSSCLTLDELKIRKETEIEPLLESARKNLDAKRRQIDSKNAEITGATDAVKAALQAQLKTLSAAADTLTARVDERTFMAAAMPAGSCFARQTLRQALSANPNLIVNLHGEIDQK